MTQTPYTEKWRDAVRPGAIRSAGALVPMLMRRFEPDSVIDVGCGEGWFCKAWAAAHASRVVGVDHGGTMPVAIDDRWTFGAVDLAESTGPPMTADLVMSLEVAEHLPVARAASFVVELCAMAPVVVFSAAAPGQGGEGHVNEQWPTWWQRLFADAGYAGSDALRWAIWTDERISAWYRQNLLVFADEERLKAFRLPVGVRDVIHPGLWAWKGHA